MINVLRENIKYSLLCAGIDPDESKIPRFKKIRNTWFYLKNYINATKDFVCCYKIQKAFFDNINNGEKLLYRTINYIHQLDKKIPIIMDCKIGDIENTMYAYMEHIFDKLNADGVVINPYMGSDVLNFAKIYPNKMFAVLVRTSNTGADLIQNLVLRNSECLWIHLLNEIMSNFNGNKNIIPILSRLNSGEHMKLKNIISENTPVLFAGVGTQNGNLSDIKYILNKQKNNVFFNVSRKLMYPDCVKSSYFIEISKMAKQLKERANIIINEL